MDNYMILRTGPMTKKKYDFCTRPMTNRHFDKQV